MDNRPMEKMETLGLLIEESNFAHENKDSVVTEDGQAVVLDNGKSSNIANHTETQIKAVLSKKKEIEAVSVVVTKEGLESVVNAIEEGYELGDKKLRSLNEVKEMLGLMAEKGFTMNLLSVAFIIRKFENCIFFEKFLKYYYLNQNFKFYFYK